MKQKVTGDTCMCDRQPAYCQTEPSVKKQDQGRHHTGGVKYHAHTALHLYDCNNKGGLR